MALSFVKLIHKFIIKNVDGMVLFLLAYIHVSLDRCGTQAVQ